MTVPVGNRPLHGNAQPAPNAQTATNAPQDQHFGGDQQLHRLLRVPVGNRPPDGNAPPAPNAQQAPNPPQPNENQELVNVNFIRVLFEKI